MHAVPGKCCFFVCSSYYLVLFGVCLLLLCCCCFFCCCLLLLFVVVVVCLFLWVFFVKGWQRAVAPYAQDATPYNHKLFLVPAQALFRAHMGNIGRQHLLGPI